MVQESLLPLAAHATCGVTKSVNAQPNNSDGADGTKPLAMKFTTEFQLSDILLTSHVRER
jgi:hypothetical protein